MRTAFARFFSLPRACCVFLAAASLASAATYPVLNDRAAGEKLAARLAAAVPDTNAAFRGVFDIERRGADDVYAPVTMSVALTKEGWQTVYAAETPAGVDRLTIVHHPGKPAVYTHDVPGRGPISVVGDRATNSFAGSDFALLDLGLEFFQWPGQMLVTKEMKKGRGCYVLESRPANTNFYSRVVSWIDEESTENGVPGLLMAHAYDARGALLKEFEVRGVKKVAGQWQVQDIELRNRQTKGSTRLRFDFGSQ